MSDYPSSVMMLGDLLGAGAISPRVNAADKRQALGVVAEIAARIYDLKAPRVFDAIMEREAVSTTGVGHGVAIPHAPIEGLTRLRGVFIRLNPAVDFGAMDDEPVDLIFTLLSPPGAGSEQLRALARIARALRRAELRIQLRQAVGPDALRALLDRDVQSSAA